MLARNAFKTTDIWETGQLLGYMPPNMGKEKYLRGELLRRGGVAADQRGGERNCDGLQGAPSDIVRRRRGTLYSLRRQPNGPFCKNLPCFDCGSSVNNRAAADSNSGIRGRGSPLQVHGGVRRVRNCAAACSGHVRFLRVSGDGNSSASPAASQVNRSSFFESKPAGNQGSNPFRTAYRTSSARL
jgi:hypothetical protein